MDKSSIKTIRNGVIASVIAGVLLTLVPSMRSALLAGVEYLWDGLVWSWQSIYSNYAAPGWAWLILLALALVGTTGIVSAVWPERTPEEFEAYVEDRFYGAVWRWRWRASQITGLWCFCPVCDATLVYDDSSCRKIMSDEYITKFICENCERQIGQAEGGSKVYALSAVKREIDRRIRTGEYKKSPTKSYSRRS